MIRQLIMSMEDDIPVLFNWGRYFKHVILKGNVTYPAVLGPIFSKIGSSNLIAVDVGANVGIFTRYLSRHFAETHAVEPIPHLARRLMAIAPRKVKVHNCALGAADGEITIRTPVDALGRRMDALSTAALQNDFALFGHDQSVATVVQQARLSELFSSQARVGFVKIDVEGFENEVLAGATELIKRDHPIFLIEISKTHNPSYEEALKVLEDLGYKGYSITDNAIVDSMRSDIIAQPSTMDEDSETNPQWDFIFIHESQRGIVT